MPSNFKSGFERTLATQLKNAKVKFEYEGLKIPYTINHIYHPDFILPNGIIIEAKGRFMDGDAAKMRAVKYQHPELDIRFVFMSAHSKVTRMKQTYAEWADRHGFPWADGRIPEEWLK
jgi:hypothetical protein